MHYLSYLAEKLVVAHHKQSKLLNRTDALSSSGMAASLAEALRDVLECEVESGRLRYNVLRMSQNPGATDDSEVMLFPELEAAKPTVPAEIAS